MDAKRLKLVGGERLLFDDGRPQHRAACTVLEVKANVIVVQFDDRADTTAILLGDRDWWDHITIDQQAQEEPDHRRQLAELRLGLEAKLRAAEDKLARVLEVVAVVVQYLHAGLEVDEDGEHLVD